MASIKLITHSSVLIQEGEHFLLTDPWFEKPAFGSWLPTPPMSVHPAYLVALTKQNTNFSILISHGHDDHLDDDFLSLFPETTRIIIPQYRSRGVLSRVGKGGFKNIVQAPIDGVECGVFKIKSYINDDISADDAVLTVETPTNFIIHANDNWQKLEGDTYARLKRDTGRFASDDILYMSQCNLADGYPNIYTDYTKEEKLRIHNERVDNIIDGSLLNAHRLGAGNFLNYAGYAAAYVKGNNDLRDRTSFKKNAHVKDICKSGNYATTVLDMMPGDTFDFATVQQQFPGISLCEEGLKSESYNFYEKYGRISDCDSFKSYETPTSDNLRLGLNDFLQGFRTFVEKRVHFIEFNVDIIGCKIAFNASDIDCNTSIIIGPDGSFDGRTATFTAPGNLLGELASGRMNWENLYIGYASTVTTTPTDTNIRAVVRWLAMYGYVYQREKRVK